MKVKLLKKIRKRYSITHYPEGLYIDDQFFKGPVTMLEDAGYYNAYEFSEKQVAFDTLYELMLRRIQKEFGTFRSNRRKKQQPISEVLWYKK